MVWGGCTHPLVTLKIGKNKKASPEVRSGGIDRWMILIWTRRRSGKLGRWWGGARVGTCPKIVILEGENRDVPFGHVGAGAVLAVVPSGHSGRMVACATGVGAARRMPEWSNRAPAAHRPARGSVRQQLGPPEAAARARAAAKRPVRPRSGRCGRGAAARRRECGGMRRCAAVRRGPAVRTTRSCNR